LVQDTLEVAARKLGNLLKGGAVQLERDDVYVGKTRLEIVPSPLDDGIPSIRLVPVTNSQEG